eukprot:TRINITY_DN59387_c0_g1_i1.p1 TRINITY_DN59387_c0_g1~~TRINITY_DN59387_c0_g1_i1.p1  ORF type:complete len:1262 (+),score=319.06 TRINITY_DN59387_c0_g1_i1:162-3947(+)
MAPPVKVALSLLLASGSLSPIVAERLEEIEFQVEEVDEGVDLDDEPVPVGYKRLVSATGNPFHIFDFTEESTYWQYQVHHLGQQMLKRSQKHIPDGLDYNSSSLLELSQEAQEALAAQEDRQILHSALLGRAKGSRARALLAKYHSGHPLLQKTVRSLLGIDRDVEDIGYLSDAEWHQYCARQLEFHTPLKKLRKEFEMKKVDCNAFMRRADGGCEWTNKYYCPDQPKPKDAKQMAEYAADDDSEVDEGYECCCNQGFWRNSMSKQAQKDMATCSTWMTTQGAEACDWTDEYTCPGQPKGPDFIKAAKPTNKNDIGYMCCCDYEGWRRKGGTSGLATMVSEEERGELDMQATADGGGDLEEMPGCVWHDFKCQWAKLKKDKLDPWYANYGKDFIEACIDFLWKFLRWEAQVELIGTSPGKLGLNWKCQPLGKCMEKLGKMLWAFRKIVRWLIELLMQGMKQAMKFIAGLIARDNTHGTVAETVIPNDEEELGPGVVIDALNEAEDLPKITVLNSATFGNAQAVDQECNMCAGRFKGGWWYDPIKQTASSPWPSLFVSTCPRPISTGQMNCMKCLYLFKDWIGRVFSENKRTIDADVYFGAGQCNAHSVGMCMMLEKTRHCNNAAVDEKGELHMRAGAEPDGAKSQRNFCDSLTGIRLELTTVAAGPVCPAVYKDQVREESKQHVEFKDPGAISSMSMRQGCHAVYKTLARFNKKCEATKDDRGNIFKRVAADSWNYLNSYKSFTYMSDFKYQDSTRVALKCRALQGCSTRTFQDKQVKSTNTDWDFLVSELNAIIEQVDDFGGKPQSYRPEEATKMIVSLIDSASQALETFEADTAAKGAKASNRDRDWGFGLQRVFNTKVWDDRCFLGLAQAPKLNYLRSKLISNDIYREGEKNFFQQLSQSLQVFKYEGGQGACQMVQVHKKARAENKDIVLDGAKIKFHTTGYFLNELANWTKGKMQLHTLTSPTTMAPLELQADPSSIAWFLSACHLRGQCGGARKFSKLQQIVIRAVSGPEQGQIHKFIAGSQQYVDQLMNANSRTLAMAEFSDFKRAIDLVTTWRDEAVAQALEQNSPTALKEPRMSNYLKQLKAIVETAATSGKQSNTPLKEFFERRGWKFDVDDKGTLFLDGVQGERLSRLNQLNRMLDYLGLPEIEPINQARDAILGMGDRLLAEAPKVELMRPDEGPTTALQTLLDRLPQAQHVWKPAYTVLVGVELSFQPSEYEKQLAAGTDSVPWLRGVDKAYLAEEIDLNMNPKNKHA